MAELFKKPVKPHNPVFGLRDYVILLVWGCAGSGTGVVCIFGYKPAGSLLYEDKKIPKIKRIINEGLGR